MKNTKLVNILRTFTRDEMKEFEKFVASPFHNDGRSFYKPLISELKKFHPNFDSDKLTYENLYRKVKPNKKFNQQVMWNIASSTEKMAEEFIAQLGLRNDGFRRMRYIVYYY